MDKKRWGRLEIEIGKEYKIEFKRISRLPIITIFYGKLIAKTEKELIFEHGKIITYKKIKTIMGKIGNFS